jgi:hypothetical protein
MNRRNFLSKLGIGSTAVAASAIMPHVGAPTSTADSGSLRPKCIACGTRVLVRWRGVEQQVYAFCPDVTCKRYGMEFSLRVEEDQPREEYSTSPNKEQIHKALKLPNAKQIEQDLIAELEKYDFGDEPST